MNTIEFSFRVSAFVFNLWSPGGSFMVQKIVITSLCPSLKGRVVQNIDVFIELIPRLRTYELRGQRKTNEKK